jgi:hypothetical protein
MMEYLLVLAIGALLLTVGSYIMLWLSAAVDRYRARGKCYYGRLYRRYPLG